MEINKNTPAKIFKFQFTIQYWQGNVDIGSLIHSLYLDCSVSSTKRRHHPWKKETTATTAAPPPPPPPPPPATTTTTTTTTTTIKQMSSKFHQKAKPRKQTTAKQKNTYLVLTGTPTVKRATCLHIRWHCRWSHPQTLSVVQKGLQLKAPTPTAKRWISHRHWLKRWNWSLKWEEQHNNLWFFGISWFGEWKIIYGLT